MDRLQVKSQAKNIKREPPRVDLVMGLLAWVAFNYVFQEKVLEILKRQKMGQSRPLRLFKNIETDLCSHPILKKKQCIRHQYSAKKISKYKLLYVMTLFST